MYLVCHLGSGRALLLVRYIIHHCGSKSWTNNTEGLQELLGAWCLKYEEEKVTSFGPLTQPRTCSHDVERSPPISIFCANFKFCPDSSHR